MRAQLAVIAGLVLTLFGGIRPASAEGEVEVFYEVKTPDPNSKNKNDAPSIEATIVGGPKVPLDKFVLTEVGAKQPVQLKAVSVREFAQGSETIAIAFVVMGQEIWIGNDDYIPEDSSERYIGILKDLKSAMQTIPFATAGPPGSKGILISYADKADIKIPMGPLEGITGEALGPQQDYKNKAGRAMVEGITLGIAELQTVTANRKALVVICDGSDVNPEAAKTSLQNLKKQAADLKIQTFAIIYKGTQLDTWINVIPAMIPGAKVANNAEGIVTEIKAILARLADRRYVTFPGFDPKLKMGLPWDGKPHDLMVKIDKDETEEKSVQLAPVWNPPKKGFPWWILGVVLGGLLLLIIIGVKVFGGKKEAPMPMPMPMAQAPVEAPKPMGPMKTVMIGAGGDSDGFPIVGWLVPLNGQDAYKTFRLRSGGTKIGTAPPSDIVVNDGFMSTEHCQINCSPAGFTLIDGGSTNGCYVNDRKVSKHDLLDNDMVTLGKTNFKFKSIN